jgi:protein-S-isoprenylcysteine O-methyltransferase Ste14
MNTKSRVYGVMQSGLFVAFAALYFLDPSPRTIGGEAVLTVAGDVLCLAGVVLLFVALRTIGKSIQIDPAPRADATLVTHGVYGKRRHPIYTAIVLILVGLVARGATPAATALAAVTIGFLLVKARYEERLLSARYPEYEAYKQSTRGVLF